MFNYWRRSVQNKDSSNFGAVYVKSVFYHFFIIKIAIKTFLSVRREYKLTLRSYFKSLAFLVDFIQPFEVEKFLNCSIVGVVALP